jgi:flagellum-specific peptidoglycan hydrolase FlgJ
LHSKKESVKNYIAQYKEIAIEEMKRTGVPAAITLAQGIHESGVGQSKLAMIANNHFGIKCKSNWTGETITHTDDAHNECFRKYASATESYKDHSDFLKMVSVMLHCFQWSLLIMWVGQMV